MRVPALILDQEHNADHTVEAPTPHLHAPEQRKLFLYMSNFPHDGWDNAIDVSWSPHGALGFVIADTAEFGALGHVLAADFESTNLSLAREAGSEHVYFDMIVHQRDGEVMERLGERNAGEGVEGEVFESGVEEGLDGE